MGTMIAHTWSRNFQASLDLGCELEDAVWRPGPEYKAVPGILITGVLGGVLQLEEMLVYDETLEGRGEELLALGGVAFGAVLGVGFLDCSLLSCGLLA